MLTKIKRRIGNPKRPYITLRVGEEFYDRKCYRRNKKECLYNESHGEMDPDDVYCSHPFGGCVSGKRQERRML